MPDTPDPTSAALVSCHRNEGQFAIEWLAYHSLLGFQDIYVYTNNCLDGSDALLDRLQALGYLTHIDHAPPPGKSPQITAMADLFQNPRLQDVEWLMHIDSDEFINIHVDGGTIPDLIESMQDCDVIAFLWRAFGDAGLTRWDGGSVMQTFTQTQPAPMRRTANHKSMFRHRKFGRCTDHMPKDPLVESFIVRNTRGNQIPEASVLHHRKSRYKTPFKNQTFEGANINHYMIKSHDLFLMKNDRGDGHAADHKKYHLGSQNFRTYNRNEGEDRSILERWEAVADIMARMRADPEVARLEQGCIDWFKARRDAVLTPDQIAAWTLPPPAQPAENTTEST